MVEMAQCSLILTSPPIRGQYLGSLISIWELFPWLRPTIFLFPPRRHLPILGSLLAEVVPVLEATPQLLPQGLETGPCWHMVMLTLYSAWFPFPPLSILELSPKPAYTNLQTQVSDRVTINCLKSLAPPSETKLLQLLTMSDYSPDDWYSFSHKIPTLVLGLLTSYWSWTTVTVNMSLTRKLRLVRPNSGVRLLWWCHWLGNRDWVT